MKSKQVIIEIDQDGNCSIEGTGFVGPECSRLLGEIERDLGVSIKREQKPEYRQIQRTRQREKN